MSLLTALPAWKALKEHHHEVASLHMLDLFVRDPKRFERFSLRLGDVLLLDFFLFMSANIIYTNKICKKYLWN